jgi:DNA-binding response OmpR family regulator
MEHLCHPDVCAECSYRKNWFSHEYSLQEFIRTNDRRKGRPYAKRILAVDDEPNFIFALEETVRENGFNCLTAIDGEEGLFFAQEVIPDLIITDIVMPKMNGFELCRALKADSRTSRIPIIVVTVRGKEADIQEGLSAGADVYMVKPFQTAELHKHIRRLTEKVSK